MPSTSFSGASGKPTEAEWLETSSCTCSWHSLHHRHQRAYKSHGHRWIAFLEDGREAADVINDGKTDIIYGQGHSYGIYWLEQKGEGASRTWVKHVIDESYSQIHALKLVDIDGDGAPELLAGKRYRGHNGNDCGSYDPLVVY